MDDGGISLNQGTTDLAVLALIRATCSRPGALGKDQYDVSGAIAKWARQGGENVLNVESLMISREGFTIELPDGTVEEGAQRGELSMSRIKHLYEEAEAGGYEYEMSITPDTVAVARRALELIVVYLWKRGVFAIQYDGMSKEEIDAGKHPRANPHATIHASKARGGRGRGGAHVGLLADICTHVHVGWQTSRGVTARAAMRAACHRTRRSLRRRQSIDSSWARRRTCRS
jgi:hypothetical protein